MTLSLRSRSNPPPQSGCGCRRGTRSWAEKNEIDDFWKIDSWVDSQNLVCETALEEVPNIVVIRSSGENNNCSCSKARNKMEKLHLNMENDINYLSWVTAIPKLVSLFFGITTSNCSKLFKDNQISCDFKERRNPTSVIHHHQLLHRDPRLQ